MTPHYYAPMMIMGRYTPFIMNLGEEPYDAERIATASRATFFVHSKGAYFSPPQVSNGMSHKDGSLKNYE